MALNLTEKISQKVIDFFRRTIESEENVAADMVEESGILLRKVSENPYNLRTAYEICEAVYSLTESSPVVLADEINRELLGRKTALTETYVENLIEAAEVVADTENYLFSETFRKALKEAVPVINRYCSEELLSRTGRLFGKLSLLENGFTEDLKFVAEQKVKEGLSDSFVESFLRETDGEKAGEKKALNDLFFYSRKPEVKMLAAERIMKEFGESITPVEFQLYLSELKNLRAEKEVRILTELGLRYGLLPKRIRIGRKEGVPDSPSP